MKEPKTIKDIIDENLGGLELVMDDDMWHFYKDVIRQCIESHTASHTAALREEIDSLKEDLSGDRILLEAARSQLSVYEAENKRLKLALYTITRAYDEYGPTAIVAMNKVAQTVLDEIGFDPSKETL